MCVGKGGWREGTLGVFKCCSLRVSVRRQKEEEGEQRTSVASSLICGSTSASLSVKTILANADVQEFR